MARCASAEQIADHARDLRKHDARLSDGYAIYCQWCEDHQRPPPTRDWWDSACALPRVRADRPLTDIEFDRDYEEREGWA